MTDHSEISEQASSHFHGEALAYDPWASKNGAWIVLGFVAIYTIFLIGMNLAGQVPGKSFGLKGASDIFQFVGEGAACFFCMRIALRLRSVYARLRRELIAKQVGHQISNDLEADRAETRAAYRAYLAWMFLIIAIALYAMGQAVWTSYDIHMNSADVPFPGLYDIGFVASYPFFLAGTILLARRNKGTVRRIYPLIDALAVIGASLALSWFFLLGPLIANLPKMPDPGAALLSLYFPTGDLFLVALAAFLMFSPLSDRAQQPVFLLLCSGLFFLAVTDSLLSYYNFVGGFNTGTLQDVFWPASMLLISLAAIAYPHSIAQEQHQKAEISNTGANLAALPTSSRSSQLIAIALTILPLILVLTTCVLLLLRITPMGGAVSIQSDFAVLALVLILVARQTLTLLENNHLITQIQSELVHSRNELYRKRREAEEANRRAQEKQELEEGLAALRSVYTRVVRGDFTARAPAIAGPLQQIALSLNIMLDQLGSSAQQSAHHNQLMQELKMVQEASERLEQGLPPWLSNRPPAQSTPELRAIFLTLQHAYSSQASQWRSLESSLELVNQQARYLRETLSKVQSSKVLASSEQSQEQAQAIGMVIDLAIHEVAVLEQQQQSVLNQVTQTTSRFGSPTSPIARLGDKSRMGRDPLRTQ